MSTQTYLSVHAEGEHRLCYANGDLYPSLAEFRGDALAPLYEVVVEPVRQERYSDLDNSESGHYSGPFDARRGKRPWRTVYRIVAARPLGCAADLSAHIRGEALVEAERHAAALRAEEAGDKRWYGRRGRPVPPERALTGRIAQAEARVARLREGAAL